MPPPAQATPPPVPTSATLARGGSPSPPATTGERPAGGDEPGSPRDAARTGAGRAGRGARRIGESLSRVTAAHAGATPAETRTAAPPPGPPVPRSGITRPTPARLVVALVAALVFAVTAFQHVNKVRLDAAVRSVAALDADSGAIVDADAQAGDENVLIVGTDPGAGTDARPRVDTVLLAHVPAGDGDVVGIAVPADLEVNRPPCRQWDAATGTYSEQTVPAQARTPLISAVDLGGPQCATRVVQQLTGLAVTRYVGLDLDAAGDLVDAVGGVRTCVGRPVVDSLLGAVVPTAGTTTLDGRQARDLLRARTVEGDQPGGRDVLERQQRLLAALLDKVLSREVLLDPGATGALGPALGAALTLDAAGLDRALAAARATRNFAADGVTFTTVPTAPGASGLGNTVLAAGEAEALFSALREGEPPPERTVLAAGGDAVRRDVPVDVLNASDRQGLAAQVGDTLGTLGFGVGEVGNAPAPTDETTIRFSPDRAAAADVLAEAVPSATSVPDPGASGVLELVLGRTFDGVLRAPVTGPADGSVEPAVPCG